jgi:hypothetical protein
LGPCQLGLAALKQPEKVPLQVITGTLNQCVGSISDSSQCSRVL